MQEYRKCVWFNNRMQIALRTSELMFLDMIIGKSYKYKTTVEKPNKIVIEFKPTRAVE